MLTTTMTKLNKMITDAQAENDGALESALLNLSVDLNEIASDVNFQLQLASNANAALDKLAQLCKKTAFDVWSKELAFFYARELRTTIANDLELFMYQNSK